MVHPAPRILRGPSRALLLLATFLVSLAGLAGFAGPASAANADHVDVRLPAAYSVSGAIRTSAGTAVPNALVQITSADFTTVDSTDAAGAYALPGLPAGSYKLRIYAPTGKNLRSGWYSSSAAGRFTSSSSSASAITVGPSRTGVNVALPTGLILAGVVKNTAGAALANVDVSATGSGYGTGRTDAYGRYRLLGLNPGSYRVRVAPAAGVNYLNGWFTTANTNRFTTSAGKATAFSLSANKTLTTIKIGTGYGISGTVTILSGKATTVVVSATSSSGYTAYSKRISTSSTSPVAYAIKGLAAGSYKVRFTPSSNAIAGYWTSANSSRYTSSAGSATGVVVGPSRTGISSKLPAGYTISGQVRDDNGIGAPFASVRYSNAGGSHDVTTDMSGNFTITTVAPGSGKLAVDAPFGRNLQSGYYTGANAAHFTADPAAASALAVGPNRTGLVVQLPAGASISGVVTDFSGSRVEYATVWAVTSTGRLYRSAFTDVDGSYTVDGLSAGSYRVYVQPVPFGAAAALAPGYYSTANANHYVVSRGSATAVTVSP